MLIFLRYSGYCTLKADRSLIDPNMKLKVDFPKIQVYLHVSQYDSLIDTSCIRLASFTLLTPIRRFPNTRLGTHHLFLLRLIIFAIGLESHFDLCY
jgi:hypothetical protein